MMRHFANFVCEITKQKILNNEAINPLLEDYDLSNWHHAQRKWRAILSIRAKWLGMCGIWERPTPLHIIKL